MKMSIARKFYLALVVPLIVVSFIVTRMTYNGLESNAKDLASALRLQGKSHSILSLLQSQDEASMALLIDPGQLEVFSAKKIGAYDDHKRLLAELKREARSESMHALMSELATFDEQFLRPIDTRILELLFEDVKAARALYFSDYEPMRLKYETKIRKLAALSDANVLKETESMRQRNFWSIFQISLSLLLGIGLVSTAIHILARQIERSEANMRSLLGALNEGLFFFDAKGEIPEERSQALAKIIPGSERISNLSQFVETYSDTPIANVKIFLDMIWNNSAGEFMSDFESTATFLPQRIKMPGARIIELEYRKIIGKNQILERVGVVATDITERLRNEREAAVQTERVRKISKAAASQESYISFVEEAVTLLKSADSLMGMEPAPPDLAQLQRDLHTLKGSLATFEFNALADEFHKLETLLEEEGRITPAVRQAWSPIKDQWKFETTDVEQVLGLDGIRGKVNIALAKYQGLISLAAKTKNLEMTELLEDCLRSPIGEVLTKYQSYLAKLSERSAGKRAHLQFKDDSSEVSFLEMQRLDASLMHIFRNCFDHGIESQDERKRLGKAPSGLIQCAVYRLKNDSLHVIIKDDGSGIDGDRLAEKALAKGLWDKAKATNATYLQKIELIFEPNISTRDAVTELSGRGVGMDAVNSALKKLGGSISIHSQPGVGTQFEIDVPGIKSIFAPERLKTVAG